MPDGGGSGTMGAAQVMAPGRVEMVEVPLALPERGEVRVRLEGSGVCASNLEPWAGQPWTVFPLSAGSLGHEGWGHVDAVGRGVTGLRVGDRVAILGLHSYASHDIVSESMAVPLPASLDGSPVPGEPAACSVMICEKARIAAGDTVAIVGTGFLGLLLVQPAAIAGARVIALSRRAEALDLARQMGAAETVLMEDDDTVLDPRSPSDRRSDGRRFGGMLRTSMAARPCRTVAPQRAAGW